MAEVSKVVCDGIKMRYAKFGTGKKPVVILPGISLDYVTDSAQAVEKQFSNFTEDYIVYIFDRRDNIPAGYTMQDMAFDTAKVIKYLGISDCYLFGASQGGMLALYIAACFPETVKKVVVGSTSATLTDSFKSVLKGWIDLAQKGEKVNLCLSFAENVYSKATFENVYDLYADFGNKVKDEDLQRFLKLANAFYSLDVEDKLNQIKCPLLAIGCSGDVMFGDYSSKIIAQKTNGEIYNYGENYGHGVYDESPDYQQRIFDFFK